MANDWPRRQGSVFRLSNAVFSIALAAAFAWPSFPASAQQSSAKPAEQDDVIRVTTNLIQVRAVVTDRKGELVDNLKQEDFEVFENDRPQKVSFFNRERVAGSTPSASTDRATSTTGDQSDKSSPGAKPSRSIVIFVDT